MFYPRRPLPLYRLLVFLFSHLYRAAKRKIQGSRLVKITSQYHVLLHESPANAFFSVHLQILMFYLFHLHPRLRHRKVPISHDYESYLSSFSRIIQEHPYLYPPSYSFIFTAPHFPFYPPSFSFIFTAPLKPHIPPAHGVYPH